jgi:hypothetical protein
MTGPVPQEWLPDAPVERLVCHWTGGGYRATPIDRLRYHLLIQGDGRIVRGLWPIGRWPAHTRRLNAGSVGIALCGMMGAVERPLDWGPKPISAFQMSRLVAVLAQLVERYELLISPPTVLSHAEVPEVFGLAQRGKWDIAVWPNRDDLSGASPVGAELRRLVGARLRELKQRREEISRPARS